MPRPSTGHCGCWGAGAEPSAGVGVLGGARCLPGVCDHLLESPSASVSWRVMGLMCPIHLQSPRVTCQLLWSCTRVPSVPTGVAEPHCAAVGFPLSECPALPCTQCTPQTWDPTQPSPHSPCSHHQTASVTSTVHTQHPVSAAPKPSPHTPRAHNTPRTTSAPHTPWRAPCIPEARAWGCSCSHTVLWPLLSSQMLSSWGAPLTDLWPPLSCFLSPAGADARVRGMATVPLCVAQCWAVGTGSGAAHGQLGHGALVQEPLEALGAPTSPRSASETPLSL